jgi:hypothetical protein
MGEISAGQKHALPKRLIQESDVKGVFHVHSTYSDGRATLEEMIRRARQLGYEYVGISDHSKSATYANGLTEERVRKQQAEMDQLQKKYKTIRIFKGIESDILEDGSLDPTLDVFPRSHDMTVVATPSRSTCRTPRQRDRRQAFAELMATLARSLDFHGDISLMRGAFEDALRRGLAVGTDGSARPLTEADFTRSYVTYSELFGLQPTWENFFDLLRDIGLQSVMASLSYVNVRAHEETRKSEPRSTAGGQRPPLLR